jgi:hypothetical protein
LTYGGSQDEQLLTREYVVLDVARRGRALGIPIEAQPNSHPLCPISDIMSIRMGRTPSP